MQKSYATSHKCLRVSNGALDGDTSTVRFGYVLHDGQAEAHALRLASQL